MPGVAELLRRAVESGDYAPLLERLAPDARLRTSSERGRRSVHGAAAVVAHLSGPGPGDVAHWEAQEFEAGAAITFEWHGEGDADRRRWYLRHRDGLVTEMWISAARPSVAAPPVLPPEDLVPGARVEPLVHGGNSGAALLRAVRDGQPPLILKRVGAGDWLARVTGDDGRTPRLHAAGAFARMPPEVRHGIVDVRRDGDAAWIVMEDSGPWLLDASRPITRAQSRLVLAAGAAMHRAFQGDAPDGAATLEARLGMCTPRSARAERQGSDLLPKQFEDAWEAFAEVVDGDVAGPVLAAVEDPGALAAELLEAAGGATLTHGDLRADNLGLDGAQVILIDWDLATAGTPTSEFAWYLAQDRRRVAATHDELEADHRAAHPGVPDREVELGMLSGLVQYGWQMAHAVRIHPDPRQTAWGREELAWWVPRARRALARSA